MQRDQPRAVWLNSLGADTLRYYAARAESSADQMLLYGLANQHDAAPADPLACAAGALMCEEPDEADRSDAYVDAAAVLAALGLPVANQEAPDHA